MGLINRIKGLFVNNTTPNTTTNIEDPILKALLGNETITRENAMSLPAVQSNVEFISNMIASVPIKLYRDNGKKVEEVSKDYRVALLNDDTKDLLDGFQWKKALVTDYLMGKGGYSVVKWNRNIISSLNYVEDTKVAPYKNEDPVDKKCQFSIYAKWYKNYEIFRILRNTKDGVTGTGLTNEISKALETALATMLYQLNLINKGGNKRGFISSQKHLSDEAMKQLKNAWKTMYQTGEESCVVLNDGLEFKESSATSVEMQLNESKIALDNQIDKVFHIKNNFKDTFKEAILPILTLFESSLNRYLLLEKEKKEGYFFAFDITELTKADMKERFEAYKIAKETGWISLNEIRYKENYDEIEGLDIIAMSLGNVLYDINKKEFYTPNTGETKGDNINTPNNEKQAPNEEKNGNNEGNKDDKKGGEGNEE